MGHARDTRGVMHRRRADGAAAGNVAGSGAARTGAITTAGVSADFFLRYQFVERGPFAAFVEIRGDVSDLDPLHTVDDVIFVGPTLTCGVGF
jgi:hypothetical protein